MSDHLVGLPGEDFIRQGLVDYNNQEVTVFSCLVAMVAPCLARAGLLPDRQPPFQNLEVELTLYRLLRAEEGNAYERYNSLLRLLISFKRVLARRIRS
jgi:hypothetical protein